MTPISLDRMTAPDRRQRDALTSLESAVAIIRDEHRSLGYVVYMLQRVLHDIASHKVQADFALIAAFLYYIDTFPDRCHHPKEEKYLFERLRKRTNRANTLLDELQSQHLTFVKMMTSIEQSFVHWQAGAPQGLKPFAQAVDAYAELLCDHMEQEESRVLAIAAEFLTHDDWHAIDEAFRVNSDPLFGVHVQREFLRLKGHIIEHLPARLRRFGPPT